MSVTGRAEKACDHWREDQPCFCGEHPLDPARGTQRTSHRTSQAQGPEETRLESGAAKRHWNLMTQTMEWWMPEGEGGGRMKEVKRVKYRVTQGDQTGG